VGTLALCPPYAIAYNGAARKGDLPGDKNVYPDTTIVRKTACHGAILGFVIGA